MKINLLIVKQELKKAIIWLENQQCQGKVFSAANDLCDSFEQGARRVPRNICADPAVEAKRAISDSLRTSLSAIKKSVLNCLNEADDLYIGEFGEALREAALEYLGLQLEFNFLAEAGLREIKILLLDHRDSPGIRLSAQSQVAQKNACFTEICMITESNGILSAAKDADFAFLIAQNNS